MVLRPGVRAELSLPPFVRAADSPRTGRESGRPGASPPRPAARPARRRPARRVRASAPAACADLGSASERAGRSAVRARSCPRLPPCPAIHCAISFRPASSGRSEPMCGIRSRPNLAMRKYRVLAYGSPGLMMRASGSAKSPRVGRTPTAFISATGVGNCSRRGDGPAAVVGMAVAAVGVQVGPGPGLQRLALVGRVGEPRVRCAAEAASNGGSGLPSSSARRMNPASVSATSWLRPSGPGRFNCSGRNASAYSDWLLWHDMHWLRLWNCQTRVCRPVVALPSRRPRRGPGRRRSGRRARRRCRRASPRRR